MSTLMFSTLIALVMSGCTNNNLSLKYKPKTPTEELIFAIQQKDLDKFNGLIYDPSIDKNYVDKDGRTALHHAILNQQVDAAKVLSALGVYTNIKDKAGKTAEDYAKEAKGHDFNFVSKL